MCDSSGDEHHLFEILQDLVGSIDSTEEPRREKERTCLDELIAQKWRNRTPQIVSTPAEYGSLGLQVGKGPAADEHRSTRIQNKRKLSVLIRLRLRLELRFL